jgi:hypothetical protein
MLDWSIGGVAVGAGCGDVVVVDDATGGGAGGRVDVVLKRFSN